MKKYKAKPHAVDRALLRFGISSEHAENWFNQLMNNAKLVGSDGTTETWDHKGKRIIVKGDEIITIIKSEDLPFGGKIAKLVERELKKAKQSLAKRERELSILIAEYTIEQAQQTLSQLKAKSPSVRNKIQAKLDQINAKLGSLRTELAREKDDFKHLEINSSAFMSYGGQVDEK
jgi:hypothetical protein